MTPSARAWVAAVFAFSIGMMLGGWLVAARLNPVIEAEKRVTACICAAADQAKAMPQECL